ncbi:MAG: hypothetical protein KDB58_08900 [Solirubrobacterales bacterium]|nr:hypothetical protein [Solirubrobacterales bacterium]
MADKIKDEGEVTVTEETPAKADTTSAPVPNDAEANQPPVRTNRPDVPIAQVLAAGAGAHEGRELDHEVDVDGAKVAVDADGIDADGRFRGEPKKSK